MAKVYQGERVFLDPCLVPLNDSFTASQALTRARNDVEDLRGRHAGVQRQRLALRLSLATPARDSAPQPAGTRRESPPDSAWNTAVSFASNTNWQGYGGETTMSYLTQMLGMTVQNFVSAATGMAVLVALIRGITRHTTKEIGNFWVDMTRSVIYILLPLSLVLALALVSQGVVQTFSEYQTVSLIQPSAGNEAQVIAVGPAASQIAIKQLGTNGGGFFNVNSAHPLENPTPFSNFLEMLSILLIPAALVLHLRQDGRRYASGLGIAGGDDDHLCGAARRGSLVRAKRQPCFCNGH
jgi:K+-transporting ATPase A subunit